MKKDQYDAMLGIIFALHAHYCKYDSVTTDLAASYTRGCDEYPDTLRNVMDILESHVYDAAHREHKKQQAKQQK